MKEVILSNGQVALVDDEDFGLVSKHRWHAKPAGRTTYCYAHAGEYKTYGHSKHHASRLPITMHRLILGLKKGDGTVVDHIDGNGVHNWKANLRMSSKSLNAANGFRSRKGRTGFRGTYFERRWPLVKPWYARISVVNKVVHLGTFATEDDAAHAYDQAAKKYFGEHAHLNFP
jgi:hypothetical protein